MVQLINFAYVQTPKLSFLIFAAVIIRNFTNFKFVSRWGA